MWKSQMNQRYTVMIDTSIKVHSNTLFLSFPKRFKNKVCIDFSQLEETFTIPKSKEQNRIPISDYNKQACM